MNMDMDMDINVNMNKMKNSMNGTSSMNDLGAMGRMSSSRGNMDPNNMGNMSVRMSDNNLAGMSGGSRRNRTRYSSGMMDYDIDMGNMNKISPEGAANHWFWNDEDY